MYQTSQNSMGGLEDLRWHSLTKPEKQAVAMLLERDKTNPAFVHLDNVAFELRICASSPGMPLVLTSRQNRATADTLNREADELEKISENFKDQPAIERSAHYAAGYLRSLINRLVKGGTASGELDQNHVVQILALDSPEIIDEQLPLKLIESAKKKLCSLKMEVCLEPVLEACSEKAARIVLSRPAAPQISSDGGEVEFEIIDENEEQLKLAHNVFDAAMHALMVEGLEWSKFIGELNSGAMEGCAAAPEYVGAAQKAASTAYTLACMIRQHLNDMVKLPWEAVSPGLKAILDGYPALKRRVVLKEFVKNEVGKYYKVRSNGDKTI